LGSESRPQSMNGWSYVEDNPVNRTDLSGRCYGPIEFLRSVPGEKMLCENLDLAIIIYTHPQATLQQREQAGAYITLWWIGHAAGAAGLVFSGYGEVIEIGRKTLEALEGCHDPVPPLPGQQPPPGDVPPPLSQPIPWWADPDKVEEQMVKRGWTPNDVDDILSNPAEKRESWDRRHNPRTGTRDNEPATVYYRSDGHYVVRNDNTGEIIQVSNTHDPNWIDPFGEPVRPRPSQP
jgi:hypothetical protein